MAVKSDLFFLVLLVVFPLVSNIFFRSIDEVDISDLDSEAFLSSGEMLTKNGYDSEKISVTTEDGYVLTLFRIPKKGPPVILVHGISDSSDEWLVLGPDRSLAYQLSDAGFDVWLFNSRGNRYSEGHIQNLPKEDYWKFNLDQMGALDLPAAIDHILNVTSYDKVFYIGFSQGTTIFFILCSAKPDYNNKIKHAILLAPVAWVNNIRVPFISVFSNNIKLISSISVDSGLYNVLPFNKDLAFNRINCYKKLSEDLCHTEGFLYFGLRKSSYIPIDRAPIIDSHLPSGLSAYILIQYLQWHKSRRFQRFDYGKAKNLEMYSTSKPPLYNVSLINAPISFFASEIDWFSDVDDVITLKNTLPNVQNLTMFNKSLEFSHLEFVFGSRANSLVNRPILDILLNQR